jgi:asparagine synthase (glutamine-hydrolysing)
MSGIVGLLQLDGSPLKPSTLQRHTDFLAFRGPDEQRMWIRNGIGFGFTGFSTSGGGQNDCQLMSSDGITWIVADARIDGREDLMALLHGGAYPLRDSNTTDAELILRAYRRWGLDCVRYLIGDFAFGIWDEDQQRLFCARDHMGVKPFFYAQNGSSLIFSNTLDCIRLSGWVSNSLNDLAIADFLLFEFNQDPATTTFADIRRLPAAHRAVWSREGSRIDQYWSLPIDEPLFYPQMRDYVDRFRELLHTVVADRLRSSQVWVFMSGGLDSPTVAAAANTVLRQRNSNYDLQAITSIDPIVPEERDYAEMVANHLNINIHYRNWTEFVNPVWEQFSFSTPEPCPNAWLIPGENRFWRALETHSRVFLLAEGPDNALRLDWQAYLSYIIRRHSYGQLLKATWRTLFSERRPPMWGTLLHKAQKLITSHATEATAFPTWFNPALAARLQLRERWRYFGQLPYSTHPIRPRAYHSLQSPLWQALFESFDAGTTKTLYEVRYPFVDIRMLRFLLAVPALPWCRSKYLLRRAMRGSLPRPVLRRKKKGLPHDRLREYLSPLCWVGFAACDGLNAYVDVAQLAEIMQTKPQLFSDNLRVRTLNHWLRHSMRLS